MIHNDYSVAKKIKAFSFTRKQISRLKGKEYCNDELITLGTVVDDFKNKPRFKTKGKKNYSHLSQNFFPKGSL